MQAGGIQIGKTAVRGGKQGSTAWPAHCTHCNLLAATNCFAPASLQDMPDQLSAAHPWVTHDGARHRQALQLPPAELAAAVAQAGGKALWQALDKVQGLRSLCRLPDLLQAGAAAEHDVVQDAGAADGSAGGGRVEVQVQVRQVSAPVRDACACR